MNLSRENEKLLEVHGDAEATPGSVFDWRADRLGWNLARMDEVFSKAYEEQAKTGPVQVEGVLQLQATLNELRAAIGRDDHTVDGLITTTDRVLARFDQSEATRFSIPGEPDKPLARAVVDAQAEFGTSTFYGVSTDACNAETKLEKFCERAHALVAAGYVGEKELEGVKVALTDMSSLKARTAFALSDAAFKLGAESAMPPSKEETFSYFSDTKRDIAGNVVGSDPRIIVSADEARVSSPGNPEAAAQTFAHEAGHFLKRDKAADMLQAGVAAAKEAGDLDPKMLDKFFPEADLKGASRLLSLIAIDKGGLLAQPLRQVPGTSVSISWQKAVQEMQGDLMEIASEKALNGNAAALRHADSIIAFRDDERLSDLAADSRLLANANANPETLKFAEEHYTAAAVENFKEKIRTGELDKVNTPEQLDKLMGESIVRGLLQEYTQVRAAELNIHHIEDGKAVKGLPDGLTLADFLAAEMSSDLRHVPGQPTLLLSEEQARALPDDAKAVQLSIGRDGEPNSAVYLTSQAPEGVSMPSVDGPTEKIGGYDIDASRAPFAQELAVHRDAHLDGPSMETGKSDQEIGGTISSAPSTEIGGQEAHRAQASEQKAETAQVQAAAEMSM